ncbi:hypothetical protein BHM03_00049981 [Ensete ventricosum]|nr:hypothetical protein BHM03_00049981 [Ensete ventricosum]
MVAVTGTNKKAEVEKLLVVSQATKHRKERFVKEWWREPHKQLFICHPLHLSSSPVAPTSRVRWTAPPCRSRADGAPHSDAQTNEKDHRAHVTRHLFV